MSRILPLVFALLAAVPPLAQVRPGDPVDRPGQTLSRWSPGSVDIHQISTGRGNAALVIMPDGTMALIDAGAAVTSGPFTEPRPNPSRSPAAWIAYYADRVLPPASPRRLDFAVITHFHVDHMGGIAELHGLMPIKKLIDRAWPDYAYPAPLTDSVVTNYRRFLQEQTGAGSLVADRIRVGRADQIVPRTPASASTFEIRAVAANGEVWTGQGTKTEMRFPKFAEADADVSWENICSIALRIRYGRFDYFTGGDMFGVPDPGMPAWIDVETPVARAIGPVDVHVVNMHGSISVENPAFLMTLRSRVIIVPSWSTTHPSQDVLKRVMAPRAYPGPRDVFATMLREPTRLSIGARAEQFAGVGHIVIRVDPGGAHYRVVVVDDSTDTLTVKSVHGPYESS